MKKIECDNGFIEYVEPSSLEFMEFIGEAGVRFDTIQQNLDINNPIILAKIAKAGKVFIKKIEYKSGDAVYTSFDEIDKNCPQALMKLFTPFAGAMFSLVMKYFIGSEVDEVKKESSLTP